MVGSDCIPYLITYEASAFHAIHNVFQFFTQSETLEEVSQDQSSQGRCSLHAVIRRIYNLQLRQRDQLKTYKIIELQLWFSTAQTHSLTAHHFAAYQAWHIRPWSLHLVFADDLASKNFPSHTTAGRTIRKSQDFHCHVLHFDNRVDFLIKTYEQQIPGRFMFPPVTWVRIYFRETRGDHQWSIWNPDFQNFT